MTRTYSPAALELMAAGVTLRQVADVLGVTPAAVSLWLRNARGAGPDLYEAIALLTDPETAGRIIALIEQTKEANL